MSLKTSMYMRAAVSGLITWMIPFLVSLLFYDKDGLVIDVFFFKSLMIVTGAIIGAIMLVWFFAPATCDYFRRGLVFGIFVLTINWALDLIVLCGLLGESVLSWFTGVGIRYIMILVMGITVGYVAETALQRRVV